MGIATLIEKVVGKQQERRVADFRDLVVQIAGGHEPEAECVAEVLRDAEKSLDDLQKSVELLGRRRELRRQYDRLPELAANGGTSSGRSQPPTKCWKRPRASMTA